MSSANSLGNRTGKGFRPCVTPCSPGRCVIWINRCWLSSGSLSRRTVGIRLRGNTVARSFLAAIDFELLWFYSILFPSTFLRLLSRPRLRNIPWRALIPQLLR